MAKDEDTSENNKEIWKDPRFAHLVSDPRFKGIPKSQKKVKIDKRFQSMFKNEKFKVKETVDKYGRKVKKSSNEDLKKYYDLDSDQESSDDEAEQKKEELAISKEDQDESGSENDLPAAQEDETIKNLPDKVKNRLKDLEIDYARGEGKLVTDSSSDEESEDEVGIVFDHVWGDLDGDAEKTDESSKRLAICNLDWDRLRALDILVMLNSFLPRGGSGINSVTIYPSEFGKERMKEEELAGPIELRKSGEPVEEFQQPESENEEENEESKTEKLREYQLNRLKYYYAVVECDTIETADILYKECDGLEYESTANKLDLRFIPDDMEFDDEPKDRITELPDLSNYVPRMFTTTALTQGKVELTWDENDLERKEFNDKLMNGKFDKLSDAELKRYVACSSSEGEEDNIEPNYESGSNESDEGETSKKDRLNKYKALLFDIKEKEEKSKKDKIEMEFSWDINKNDEEDGRDADPKTLAKEQDNLNPFEKKLEKIKEKKKKRKEMKKKKKRGLDDSGDESSSDDEELPYGVDLKDPFFKDAYDEDMQDTKSKKKSKKKIEASEDEEEKDRKNAELALLLEDDKDEEKEHFNLAKIQESELDLQKVSKSKRKRILKKSKKEIEASKKKFDDGFKINADDNRFAAVFSNPKFNIDPTDPHFKKTKGMETLIHEKLKKRTMNDEDTSVEAKKSKLDAATALLVKNLKRKVGKNIH